MKPCSHPQAKTHCRICWLFDHDARYRALWGGDPADAKPAAQMTEPETPVIPLDRVKRILSLPCVHLGDPLEDVASCGCSGMRAVKRACAVREQCRVYPPPTMTDLPWCVQCDQYTPSKPKLTIAMACWDDAEGAFWTLSSLRLHHVPAGRVDIELLVIDDMPTEQETLKRVCANAGARYLHAPTGRGPAAAKDAAWANARADHVLLIDSHVLLAPGAVQYMLKGITDNAVGRDMWVGPLLNESGQVIATEMRAELRGDALGVWHVEHSTDAVREIRAHGGAFVFMAREHYPGFPKQWVGFANEEVYLHDRVRANGGRVLAHRALGWSHRFERFNKPITYRLNANDKMRNALIAAHACGWNVEQIRAWFGKFLPDDQRRVVEALVEMEIPGLFTRDYADVPRFPEHVAR